MAIDAYRCNAPNRRHVFLLAVLDFGLCSFLPAVKAKVPFGLEYHSLLFAARAAISFWHIICLFLFARKNPGFHKHQSAHFFF
ncbi:MAG: hypothetical protein DA330_05455 [Nitrososphaera sp.]|nr:hypothetical protein [Nitrososphaera sp.]